MLNTETETIYGSSVTSDGNELGVYYRESDIA